jgi:Protein of unknown function (DUF2695)
VTTLMTPTHPRWVEFLTDLGGPKGCNFSKDASGRTIWECDGAIKRPICRRVLRRYDVDVAESLKFLAKHGGYCDCEVTFNVERSVGGDHRGTRHVAVKVDSP